MVSPAGTNYSQSIKITTITMITGYFGILKDLKTPIFGHRSILLSNATALLIFQNTCVATGSAECNGEHMRLQARLSLSACQCPTHNQRIKTYLHSKMTDDRLSNLALLHIERYLSSKLWSQSSW